MLTPARLVRGLLAALLAAATGVAVPAAVAAQAWRYVDANGKVVYSQTPPPGGSATRVDVTPPPRAHAAPVPDRYERRALRRQAQRDRQAERARAGRDRRERREQAREDRVADLKARCLRNRGTDCDDPETLRRMEADSRPRAHRR